MDHQDWTPVILNKKKEVQIETQKKKPVIVNEQLTPSQYKNAISDDPDAPKHISVSLSKQIQQARMAKGITQKDLAMKLKVTADVIRDYENGKAIPSHSVIQNIQKTLGVKFEK